MKGNFNKLINGDRPVLIDFYATWCGPCKMQMPILKDLAKELNGNTRIIKIDIDKNQHIAQSYNVKSVPTLMLFENGQIKWQATGLQRKQVLLEAIGT